MDMSPDNAMFIYRKGQSVKCMTIFDKDTTDYLESNGYTHESTLNAWTVLSLLYTSTDQEAGEMFKRIRNGE